MFRRLFWLTIGVTAGAWMVIRAQRLAAHLTPSGLAADVQSYGRHLIADLRAAAAEARRTKREVEVELRPEEGSARPVRPPSTQPIDARATDSRPALGRPGG